MSNKLCSKCKTSPRSETTKDHYCLQCRKIVNAKRNNPEARTARIDKHYWTVTVPKLQRTLNARYPIRGGKVGVYYQQTLTGPDNEECERSTYKHMSWEGYQIKLDKENA